MVNLDAATPDPGNLLTPAEMVGNVTTILSNYVEPERAEEIARRAVGILISTGYVEEWGLTEGGDPLYEPHAHITFVL